MPRNSAEVQLMQLHVKRKMWTPRFYGFFFYGRPAILSPGNAPSAIPVNAVHHCFLTSILRAFRVDKFDVCNFHSRAPRESPHVCFCHVWLKRSILGFRLITC